MSLQTVQCHAHIPKLTPWQSCRNLWRGCEQRLEALDNGSRACLQQRQVQSLTALEEQHGPYDAVIVAAGAAAGVLPEISESPVTRFAIHVMS